MLVDRRGGSSVGAEVDKVTSVEDSTQLVWSFSFKLSERKLPRFFQVAFENRSSGFLRHWFAEETARNMVETLGEASKLHAYRAQKARVGVRVFQHRDSGHALHFFFKAKKR